VLEVKGRTNEPQPLKLAGEPQRRSRIEQIAEQLGLSLDSRCDGDRPVDRELEPIPPVPPRSTPTEPSETKEGSHGGRKSARVARRVWLAAAQRRLGPRRHGATPATRGHVPWVV
jgi:hypothetical protein